MFHDTFERPTMPGVVFHEWIIKITNQRFMDLWANFSEIRLHLERIKRNENVKKFLCPPEVLGCLNFQIKFGEFIVDATIQGCITEIYNVIRITSCYEKDKEDEMSDFNE